VGESTENSTRGQQAADDAAVAFGRPFQYGTVAPGVSGWVNGVGYGRMSAMLMMKPGAAAMTVSVRRPAVSNALTTRFSRMTTSRSSWP